MDDDEGMRRDCTVVVDLRTASFWLAGVLFTVGSLGMLGLGIYAGLHPDTDVHLGTWLLGMMAASAILAAFTTCGYAALAKLLTDRLDEQAARNRQCMREMREQFGQEVDGFVAGVDHVMGFLRGALPEQQEPSPPPPFDPDSNVYPFPSKGDRDYASAN